MREAISQAASGIGTKKSQFAGRTWQQDQGVFDPPEGLRPAANTREDVWVRQTFGLCQLSLPHEHGRSRRSEKAGRCAILREIQRTLGPLSRSSSGAMGKHNEGPRTSARRTRIETWLGQFLFCDTLLQLHRLQQQQFFDVNEVTNRSLRFVSEPFRGRQWH
jgi:hypothetical protein